MKAEERKENETNSLRLWVNRHIERLQGKGLYILIGSVVLAVVGILVVRFYFSSRAAAASARLMEYNSADTDQKLEKIITEPNQQGHKEVTWAKMQKARLALYRDGIDKLGAFDPKDREKAIAKVEDGRKIYLEIINDLKDSPALQQEAYASCAKAEECLMATPKADNATEYRGDIGRAIDYLRKAAAINPDSEAGKRYTAAADKMNENREKIEDFYRQLNRQGFTAPIPK